MYACTLFLYSFATAREIFRDVVRVLEEEMLDTFDDRETKPVSAAFTAPIPVRAATTTSGGGASASASSSARATPEAGTTTITGRGEKASSGEAVPTLTPVEASPSASLPMATHTGTTTTATTTSPSHGTSITVTTLPSTSSHKPARLHLLSGLSPISASAPSANAASAAYSPYTDHYFPVMEATSQEAVEEMVDKTFAAVMGQGQSGSRQAGNGRDDDERMSFEQFRKFVETDGTMIAWFEALGTIF